MTNDSTPLPQGFPEVRGADFDYKQSVTQEYQHISNVRTERIFLREGLKDCQEGSRICTLSVCSAFFIKLNSLSASSKISHPQKALKVLGIIKLLSRV